ncbi:MAG: polysaccharide deacetylase family protein, partial [Candidatus Omnitrophota bacterium]
MNNNFARTSVVLILAMFIFANTVYADLHKKRNIEGAAYWHGDSNKKNIAITFDDGPNKKYTPQILDILKKS